ncbi:MAG: metallophosphoesterase [Spirochaetes bacterium]|nr:metallophosphoesterase [Spirochaetota bacterium]
MKKNKALGRIFGDALAARRLAWIAGAFLFICSVLPAQSSGSAGAGKDKEKPSRDAPLPTEVAALARLSVILGRPTYTSVTLNILADRDQDVRVAYGTEQGSLGRIYATTRLLANEPAEVLLDGLQPDRKYFYRLLTRLPSAAAEQPGPEGRFHTCRAPGSVFSFEIIGDSHPERPQQFDPQLYAQTLKNAAADGPDFFMTIGDDFSVDTLASVTGDAVDAIYRRQRLYLSLVGSVAPIFLVNGNHEQASLANLDGTAKNVAVWAQTMRNVLFPQPAPDAFYTGNAEPVEHIGLLRDYYAWTWGDALFIVIDPYWHSPEPVDNVLGGGEKTRDLWKTTLGDAQYAWFKKTLETSTAKFKFIFSHHVLGTSRGGIERAPFYEWGGLSTDGRNEFAARRPGWELPIHQLMVKHKVTVFVQGHDHLFACELLDGVVYLTLPEPADPDYVLYDSGAFPNADTVQNSGRIRFTVGPARVVVEYFREWLPGDRPSAASSGRPAYSFTIPAGGLPSAGVFDASQIEANPPLGENDRAEKGKKKKGN